MSATAAKVRPYFLDVHPLATDPLRLRSEHSPIEGFAEHSITPTPPLYFAFPPG